jgi:predicted metal-dependent phosphoesterase TrpH
MRYTQFMRRFVDLHTHSNASDGTLSPEQVVQLANARSLAAVALTDHDTTDGIAAGREAASALSEIRFIPGIEISAQFPPAGMHIVGLGIDEGSAELSVALARLRAARNDRNPKIIKNLQELGMDISMPDVLSVANETRGAQRDPVVSRAHIAETMRRRGLVRNTTEAFKKYIGEECPGFVDKECLTPPEAITVIREAGGMAILAHPTHLNYANRRQLQEILRDLISMGMQGIEAYHPDHTPAQTRTYLDLGRDYNLLITGGSDFHGEAKPQVRLGQPPVPLSLVSAAPGLGALLT